MKTQINLFLLLFLSVILSCSDRGDTGSLPTDSDDEGNVPSVPDDEIEEHDFLMGSILAFRKDLRNGNDAYQGGNSTTTFYNKPLFESYEYDITDEDWWNNIVEEYLYSGLDYIAMNCRGRLPKADIDPKYNLDHGDPTKIKELLLAFKRKNVENLKIAIFDDCPASWAAARNFDKFNVYSSVISKDVQTSKGLTDEEVLYPLDDLDEIYKYIWDYNIKLAFDNFYGENIDNNKYLLRYRGKPVLFLWSINGFLNIPYSALGGNKIDCVGRLKKILEKLRFDFIQTFGEDVFLCVDKSFFDRDLQVNASIVDARHDWFTASEQASNRCTYSLVSLNDNNIGVVVPGFLTGDKSGKRMFFDSDHGNTLIKGLKHMVDFEADIVLLEGFNDMAENAAYFRSVDTKFYDFPNQRLNILRKYSSKNSYPSLLRVEIEACDYYKDNSKDNSGLQYRKGDLDVKKCKDIFDDWCVTNTESGEWMKWVELPFCTGESVVKLRYSSNSVSKIRLDIGEEHGEVYELKNTNGAWADTEVFKINLEKNGWHQVILNVISGNVDLNYFTILKNND